jgi:hypothetical protein
MLRISDRYSFRGVKQKPFLADNSPMARAFSLLMLIAVLGACGAAVYSRVSKNGFWTSVHRLGFRQSGRQVAEDELLSAATQLQSDRTAWGTFRRSDLSHFEGMSFGYATESAYCIQVTKAGKWYHLTGPEGVPLDGSCT